MSNLSEAVKGIREFSRLIRQPLFKNIGDLDAVLQKLGAIEAAESEAQSRMESAVKACAQEETKLQVRQNALTAAESAIQAVHLKAKVILDKAEAQGSEILKRREEEGRKFVAAAGRERDGIQKEILAGGQALEAIRKATEKAGADRRQAEEKLRQVREQAQSIGRG